MFYGLFHKSTINIAKKFLKFEKTYSKTFSAFSYTKHPLRNILCTLNEIYYAPEYFINYNNNRLGNILY